MNPKQQQQRHYFTEDFDTDTFICETFGSRFLSVFNKSTVSNDRCAAFFYISALIFATGLMWSKDNNSINIIMYNVLFTLSAVFFSIGSVFHYIIRVGDMVRDIQKQKGNIDIALSGLDYCFFATALAIPLMLPFVNSFIYTHAVIFMAMLLFVPCTHVFTLSQMDKFAKGFVPRKNHHNKTKQANKQE